MAKKKKKGKSGKGNKKKFQDLKYSQLVQEGKKQLELGKPREVVSVLKFAGKKFGLTDEIKILIFRAYLMREKQLLEKNLKEEAVVVKKLALEFIGEFENLSENDLKLYLSAATEDEAFFAYSKYLESNKKSDEIERILGGFLFKSNNLKLAESLGKSHILYKDGIFVHDAVNLMNEGKWEEALLLLKSVSRKSPYAAVRLFCRGMVSFYKKEDLEALKAFSMIPDEFPLKNVSLDLINILSEGIDLKVKNNSLSRLSFLFDGAVTFEADVNKLFNLFENKLFKQVDSIICKIADAIKVNNDIESAIFFVLEVCFDLVVIGKIEEVDLNKIGKRILPERKMDLFWLKIKITGSRHNLFYAGKYISKYLNKEFPDISDRKIAHSQILLHIIRGFDNSDSIFYSAEPFQGYEKYKKEFGLSDEIISHLAEDILLDISIESIRLDPENREGYELFVNIPRNSKQSRKKTEKVLTSMMKIFPDDPFPCLELASVYYDGNAFRKAEKILNEAMKRAPHEDRVRDKHALALLISADKNLKRKNNQLAERDINHASDVGSKRVAPYISVKRVVFKLTTSLEKGVLKEKNDAGQLLLFGKSIDADDLIKKEFESFSFIEKLRFLCLVILDFKENDISQKRSLLKKLNHFFSIEIKNLKDLSSQEIVTLLSPPEKDFGKILPVEEFSLFFLTKSMKILGYVDNKDILNLYELLLGSSFISSISKKIRKYIIKDVKVRLKKVKGNEAVLFEFFHMALRHFEGEILDLNRFNIVIKRAEELPVLENLRMMSRRLAKYAPSELIPFFENFNFDYPDMNLINSGFPDEDIDEYDDFFPVQGLIPEDDYGFNDNLFQSMEEIIDLLDGPDSVKPTKMEVDILISIIEQLTDSMNIRGLPDHMIKEVTMALNEGDPEVKKFNNSLRRIVKKWGIKKRLSSEAQVIF